MNPTKNFECDRHTHIISKIKTQKTHKQEQHVNQKLALNPQKSIRLAFGVEAQLHVHIHQHTVQMQCFQNHVLIHEECARLVGKDWRQQDSDRVLR